MSMGIFINLPVKDLAKATAFFSKIGFTFDAQSSDTETTRMIVNDGASVILQAEPTFRTFTEKEIPDTSRSREVIVGLAAESREQVDDLTGKAVAAGGEALGEPQDQGFMYMRGFRDLDGHQWSFIHMDMSAFS